MIDTKLKWSIITTECTKFISHVIAWSRLRTAMTLTCRKTPIIKMAQKITHSTIKISKSCLERSIMKPSMILFYDIPLTIKDNSITSFIFKIKNLDQIKSITYRISCQLPSSKVICIINDLRHLKNRELMGFSGIVVSLKMFT